MITPRALPAVLPHVPFMRRVLQPIASEKKIRPKFKGAGARGGLPPGPERLDRGGGGGKAAEGDRLGTLDRSERSPPSDLRPPIERWISMRDVTHGTVRITAPEGCREQRKGWCAPTSSRTLTCPS